MTGAGAAVELHFKACAPAQPDKGVIALVSINRPEAANAFNPGVISGLVDHLRTAAARVDCRALVLRGKGRHFSAGADLAWMKAAGAMTAEENLADAGRLTGLFEAVAGFPRPVIALVTGSAYGGAVGLTAAADIALAAEDATFALSEARLGILPAVIWPYLRRKMQPGALRRLALSGRPFTAQEALAAGLVQAVVPRGPAALGDALRHELNQLLKAAPEAQAELKALADKVDAEGGRQGPWTGAAIAKLRTGVSGQAGLTAFFAKTAPPWVVTLPDDWTLDDGNATES